MTPEVRAAAVAALTWARHKGGWTAASSETHLDALIASPERARALIAALLTEAPDLDVERLARALTPHFGPSYFPGKKDVTIFAVTPTEAAEVIVEAYRVALRDKP